MNHHERRRSTHDGDKRPGGTCSTIALNICSMLLKIPSYAGSREEAMKIRMGRERADAARCDNSRGKTSPVVVIIVVQIYKHNRTYKARRGQ